MTGKQWELWADTTAGRLNDILRQLGIYGWTADGNAAGATLLVPSDGPMPEGLAEVKAALDERGITCSLS